MSEVTCKSGLTESEKSKIFWASFLSLTAAGVGFVFRVMIPNLWSDEFNISLADVGGLTGAALWPIAITMIIFSLLVDKIGYKVSMFCAFALQALSVVLTIFAKDVDALWWACFAAGLGHGVVEAVINPLCAAIYREDKSKMLNILHASWPAGIVLGGVAYLLMINTETSTWSDAKWIFWVMLAPVVLYGIMFFLVKKWPVDERVEANVSNGDMLKEFGGLGAGLAITFLFYEISGKIGIDFGSNNPLLISILVGVAGGFMVSIFIKSLLMEEVIADAIKTDGDVLKKMKEVSFASKGKWMFFILCLIMIPLATAEIATDGWIRTLMEPLLGSKGSGWAIVMSAGIMMALRFFAGVPLKYMSPPALLLLSSVFSIIGLFALSAVSGLTAVIIAFVFYAVGQTFYWPTVLGFVSEQFPKGGAMTLNTVSAMGLLTVGIFGFPFLGAVQDNYNAKTVMQEQAPLVDTMKESKVLQEKKFFGFTYDSVNAGEARTLAASKVTGVAIDDVKKIEAAQTEMVKAAKKLAVDEGKDFKELLKPVVVEGIDSENITSVLAAQEKLDAELRKTGQSSLKVAAVLPGIMAIAFLLIIFYYKAQGGYKPVVLDASSG
ncbi:MAG: MFS transporter, partial [Lentisphaeraceae bacterium]|nr:MFS transporter [Lentisphaeraceae bacterium]